MPTFSRAKAQDVTVEQSIFTVPNTSVLTSLSVANKQVTAVDVTIKIGNIVVAPAISIPPNAAFNLINDERFTLYAGDDVKVTCSAACDVHASWLDTGSSSTSVVVLTLPGISDNTISPVLFLNSDKIGMFGTPDHRLNVKTAGRSEIVASNTTDLVKGAVIADTSVSLLGSISNHPVGVIVNNAEVARFSSSGLSVGTSVITANSIKIQTNTGVNTQFAAGNSLGTAYYGVDNGGNGYINVIGAFDMRFSVNTVEMMRITSLGIKTVGDFMIYSNTSDASDSKSLTLAGGGDALASRGAFVRISGNEHADLGGVVISTGNGGGSIKMQYNGTSGLLLDTNGRVLIGSGAAAAAAGYTAAGDVTMESNKGIRARNTARAWVRFNGTGTVAIVDSFNVSSITDNGTGYYTVNLTNAMADANYCALVTGYDQASANTTVTGGPVTASTINIYAATATTGASRDIPNINVVVFDN